MADVKDVQIEESWKKALEEEFQQPYFAGIKSFLLEQRAAGKTVYPPGNLIFNAFNLVPIHEVKAVILGQDPYHGPGQAHGLSFSVPKGTRIPPSLLNVYKALEKDIDGFTRPKHGYLEDWAKQGVFLLNTILTVEHKKPKSHAKAGWTTFTDAVIRKISSECEGVVFMLWGGPAKKKAALIDHDKHLVLEYVHPSPLAGKTFPDCTHFSETNAYLKAQGKEPIDWTISD